MWVSTRTVFDPVGRPDSSILYTGPWKVRHEDTVKPETSDFTTNVPKR